MIESISAALLRTTPSAHRIGKPSHPRSVSRYHGSMPRASRTSAIFWSIVGLTLLGAVVGGWLWYDLYVPRHVLLSDAIERGDLKDAKRFLRRTPVDEEQVDDRYLSLYRAIWMEFPEGVAALLQYGVDPDAPGSYWSDFEGGSGLHDAVSGESPQIARLLIEHGADVDHPTASGMTPLHLAVRDDSRELAKLLLAAGADPNRQAGLNEDWWESGGTPLHWAIRHGHEAMARLLLSNGADPNLLAHDDLFSSRITTLGLAMSCRCSNGLIEALLVHGADATQHDIDQEGRKGRAPIHYAATYASAELIRRLIDQGADVAARTADGQTPLMEAAVHNGPAAVEAVLARGADALAKDALGQTTLDQIQMQIERFETMFESYRVGLLRDCEMTDDQRRQATVDSRVRLDAEIDRLLSNQIAVTNAMEKQQRKKPAEQPMSEAE